VSCMVDSSASGGEGVVARDSEAARILRLVALADELSAKEAAVVIAGGTIPSHTHRYTDALGSSPRERLDNERRATQRGWGLLGRPPYFKDE
jgi:hypothetical protein